MKSIRRNGGNYWTILPGFSLLTCVVLSAFAADEPQEKKFVLGHGSDSVVLNADGVLVRWEGGMPEKRNPVSSSAGEVRYAGKILKLAKPAAVSRLSNELAFTYQWPEERGLQVVVRHQLNREDGVWTWKRQMQVKSDKKLAGDLTVFVESGLQQLPSVTWLPLVNGVGAPLGTNETAAYRLAGTLPQSGAMLALPMVSAPRRALSRHSGQLMIAADPYFSAVFTATAIGWTYPAEGGLENGCETRSIFISSHKGSPEQSLDCFFRTVLPDIPPGPKWLHDIALVDYDYMSDRGEGWFHDIDTLASALPQEDRHKVLFCLHGWYDFLGRYCFDAKTGKFDREWTVFSSYEATQKAPKSGSIGGDSVEVGFANCKPLNMSVKEVHARLNYARAQGFRVGIYFADGMNAGEGLADFDPKCVLEWGGWQGADSKGRSYIQNPLHPKVRNFYLAYAKALLAEFGPDIDMLDWDETFHIPAGRLGTKEAPGYADRAAMRLTHDLTCLVDDYDRAHHQQIAFLTSDCLGAVAGAKDKAPYALMAHGTYQDSWCQPQAWSYGIFPNYRNVLWSCCWWPVTKWAWIDYGVRNYQAAVSLSNGWGDDKGFSEMTVEQRARVLALFNWRKDKPTKLKWFQQLPAAPVQSKGG